MVEVEEYYVTIKQCKMGHYYDEGQYLECPYCTGKTNINFFNNDDYVVQKKEDLIPLEEAKGLIRKIDVIITEFEMILGFEYGLYNTTQETEEKYKFNEANEINGREWRIDLIAINKSEIVILQEIPSKLIAEDRFHFGIRNMEYKADYVLLKNSYVFNKEYTFIEDGNIGDDTIRKISIMFELS